MFRATPKGVPERWKLRHSLNHVVVCVAYRHDVPKVMLIAVVIFMASDVVLSHVDV